MKNTVFRLIFSGFFLFFLLCSTVYATDLLITVHDSEDAAPIPQANVYMDGTNIGQTTSGGTYLLSHERNTDFTLRIVKNGYEEWNATISPDLPFLEVALSRLTQVLTVQVYDADSLLPIANATVTLSSGTNSDTGTCDGSGAVTLPVVADTRYTITISAPGYRTTTAGIVAGKSLSETTQYWLLSNDRISFTVTDETGAGIEGATIYLDGERVGITDDRGALILTLPRDVLYAIEVKKDGYQDYLDYRTPSESEAVLPITMTQGLKSGKASLTVYVLDREKKPVPGASLSLNGNEIGRSDDHGQVVAEVPYDTSATITAQKDGYITASVETTVIAGNATLPLEITLDRAPDWGFYALLLLGGVILLALIIKISRRRRPARHIVRRNEI